MVKKGITGQGRVVASAKEAIVCPNCKRVIMPDQIKDGQCIYCNVDIKKGEDIS